ncbi:MAG: glycosyltransferase, partial [Deltaproteobacteria bacterium]|nr:glycosyltransferase [Deltaproteobacteria bacterium]
MGHRVSILAASYSHVRSVQPKVKSDVETETIDGVKYIWIKTSEYSGNNLRRVFNMLEFSGKLYAQKILFERPDIVIDSSTYPLTIFGSYKIAKMNGAKLIFEVHDLWPLSPVELGGYSRLHPFIMIMQFAENFSYTHAQRVVSLLPCAGHHMQLHGMTSDKFVYIPNGIDISEWKLHGELPEEHQILFNKLKRDKNF